jgi:hypothetical protein
MKNFFSAIALFMVISIFFIGCNKGKTDENKSETANIQTAAIPQWMTAELNKPRTLSFRANYPFNDNAGVVEVSLRNIQNNNSKIVIEYLIEFKMAEGPNWDGLLLCKVYDKDGIEYSTESTISSSAVPQAGQKRKGLITLSQLKLEDIKKLEFACFWESKPLQKDKPSKIILTSPDQSK